MLWNTQTHYEFLDCHSFESIENGRHFIHNEFWPDFNKENIRMCRFCFVARCCTHEWMRFIYLIMYFQHVFNKYLNFRLPFVSWSILYFRKYENWTQKWRFDIIHVEQCCRNMCTFDGCLLWWKHSNSWLQQWNDAVNDFNHFKIENVVFWYFLCLIVFWFKNDCRCQLHNRFMKRTISHSSMLECLCWRVYLCHRRWNNRNDSNVPG